jgi:hypothetical protein
MPVTDLLIDSTSGNKVISFLNGNAGYNPIFMAKEDVSKTVLDCPGFVGLFEWVVMTFGLKNVGTMYQRPMNLIFHNFLRVLWAHRTSRHRAMKVTPFELVYGQEAVLHVEIGLHNLRVIRQGSLSAKEYHELMMSTKADLKRWKK